MSRLPACQHLIKETILTPGIQGLFTCQKKLVLLLSSMDYTESS